MALASADDVVTSLMRSLTASESQYVEALLDRAETLLLARIPDLTDRAATDSVFHDLVVMTEAEAVARVFRNPAAYRQETEGNYSYSLNYEVASGLLDVLAREWERLGLKEVAVMGPATDGYLAARAGRPDLNFQYGWPGHNSHSEGGWFRL